MRKLTSLPPSPLYLERFTAIRDRKHLEFRTRLVSAHPDITAQYAALESAASSNALHSLTPNITCAGINDALRSCYEGPTKALHDLKVAITSAQPARVLKYCPMCGTTIHSTFDHYVPLTRFPEFSVHPLNLVPCCAACNSAKSHDWLNANGDRQYIHAYSDSPPDVVFIAAMLHEAPGYTSVGATFTLLRPNTVDNNLWALIESHFKRLRLLERYNELSNDEIAEILSSAKTYIVTGGPDVRAFLTAEAADREQVHGKSHWRAVLLRAIAQHTHLEDWIAAIATA